MPDQDMRTKRGKVEFDVNSLEGVEKAAILLLSLSEEDAAQILKHLEPKQVQKVGMAMASLEDFNQDKVNAVHHLFLEEIQKFTNIGFKSEEFVRKALTSALGSKAGNLIEQIVVASERSDSRSDGLKQVATIIRNEHPQIQTIVLLFGPDECRDYGAVPGKSALINDAYRQLEVQPAALQELNEIMEKRSRSGHAQAAKMAA